MFFFPFLGVVQISGHVIKSKRKNCVYIIQKEIWGGKFRCKTETFAEVV